MAEGVETKPAGAEKTKKPGSSSKGMRLYEFLLGHLSKIKASGQCKVFGIMVVGETGTGKSSLINNLLGQDVAEEGDGVDSKTGGVLTYDKTVHDIPVVIYDTPGLGDSDGGKDAQHIKAIEDALKSKNIQLVIYCQKLSENRMRRSLIRTFQQYHAIGVDWTRTVIALTFADSLPISGVQRKKEGFNEGEHFNQKLTEWQNRLQRTLTEEVGLKKEVVEGITIRPTSAFADDELPNGEGWYIPMWLNVLEILTPEAMVRFLEIQDGNIIVHLNEEQKRRFVQIMQAQIEKWKVRMGDIGRAIKGFGSNVLRFIRNNVSSQNNDDQQPD